MNFIPVKTPKLLKGIFPKYVWNMPLSSKVIYLTFDDGPTPEITNWTLDLLKSYQAKATFFCIGNNVEKHSNIVQDILKDGHAIGNHTFNHPKGWKTKTEVYVEEVLKTQELINHEVSKIPNDKFRTPIVGQNQNSKTEASQKSTSKQIGHLNSITSVQESPILKLFRPPYGQITPSQGKRLLALDYKIIMWDILAFDWKDDLTKAQCAQNVISKASNGSIVVFHDSVKASERMKFALAKTLEHFSKEGYTFKSIAL